MAVLPALRTVSSATGTVLVTQSGSTLTITANVAITSYLVYRENPGSTTFVEVGTTSGATTYSDTGLAAGSTYRYEVKAADSAGTSPFS